jgi:PhzF family phenazine biosynthesis protein
MTYTLYQVDAFTDTLFGGNPAAVIPLNEWIDESLMQSMAMENNLSDTAFFVPSDKADADYDIRWFTPVLEINLCGHATLAAAYILFNRLQHITATIKFSSKSGFLTVTKKSDKFEMEFPSWKPQQIEYDPVLLKKMLGDVIIRGTFKNRDLIVELESEEAVRACDPDLSLLKKSGEKLIITAPGKDVDFVSRFFAPVAGIDEDPVTGSAHSQLVPFWASKTGKRSLHAKQLSKRGGELWCEDLGDRVTIAGRCVFYMKGEIELK